MAESSSKKVETIFRQSPTSIRRLTRQHWRSLEPFNLAGEPAVWKSIGVFLEAQAIAADEGREFFDWNRSLPEMKQQTLAEPEKYFIFADLRASEMDIGEMRLQDMKSSQDYITYKYNILFKVLSQRGSMGIVFFDEMNLAPGMIKAQFYKVINDHAVGDLPLAEKVLCICAGNEAMHARNVTPDDVPLVLRRANYFVRPPTSEEYLDYAVPAGHHQWVLGYLGFQPMDVHNINYNLPDSVGQPCSRTWTKLSNMLNSNPKMVVGRSAEDPDDELFPVAQGYVGQAVATKFHSFVRAAKKIDLDSYLKKPELIKELEKENDVSLVYAVFAGVVEKFRTDKDGKTVKPAFEMSLYVRKVEMGVFLLRSMKSIDDKKFAKAAGTDKIVSNELMDKVLERYAKYLFRKTADD